MVSKLLHKQTCINLLPSSNQAWLKDHRAKWSFAGKIIQLPSGKPTKNYGKLHFSWENSLFLWPFSIAM